MTIIICMAIISGIFAGDLWIKNQIEKKAVEGETKELFGGKLLLRKHHNKGIMLNLAEGKRPVVAALSAVITLLGLLALFLSFGQSGNNLLRIGLSLLLGGAFSNTYDRLKRKYVVDYVSFGVKWKRLRRVIFNISDFCIIIGALVISIGAMQ